VAAGRRADVERRDEQRGAGERGGVAGQRPGRRGDGDDQSSDPRAGDAAEAPGEADERVRFLQMRGGDDLLDEAGRGGSRERARGAEDDLERGDPGDAGVVRQQQKRRRRLRAGTDRVAAREDELAGQPVGPDPAREQENDHRDLARQQDKTQVGRPAEPEHRKRERHGRHPVAEHRDGGCRRVA
jgi:hypothetical protein